MKIGCRNRLETVGRILLVFGIAFLAIPSTTFGGLSDFTPRIYNNEGELQIGGLYDGYRSSAAGRVSETTDAYISERFVLTTTGYVYHPRFVQFFGQFAVGFNQEKYTQTNSSPSVDESWQNVFKGEYELRAIALPEHPYSLEAYTLRKEPMVRGLSAGLFKSVITSSGAIFKYKERPYSLTLSYDHSNIESRTFTTDYDTFVASAGYTKEWGSFWGGYTHTDSDTQGGVYPITYTQDSYGLGNQLNFWKKNVLLVSTLTENKFSQDTYLSSVDDDRRTWKEQLNMYLPWNFDVSLSYRYEDDEQTTRPKSKPSEVTLWNKNNNAIFQVTQRLYQSLVTSYSYNYYETTSSGGDSTTNSQILTSTYRKKISPGYLNAGFSLGRSITDGHGAPSILNETHNSQIWGVAPPPAGEFSLSGINIDEASLRMPGAVQVKSAVSADYWPLLVDFDYQVIRYGNNFTIRILSVPAGALSPNLYYTYEFRVSYSNLATDFEIKTTNVAYSLRLDLFDRYFNPYYNYSRSDREVLSGYFPGGDEKVTINTVGVSSERPFYTLIAEYQDYNSTLNPSKTFRADGTVWDTFNETTTLTANAYYMNRVYEAVPEFGTPGYTERTLGGRVRGEKKYPRQNLTASLAVNYWQTDGMYLTRSGQVIGQLAWKIGLMDLTLGAEIGKNETELLLGKQEVNHNLYYFTMKRKLFGR